MILALFSQRAKANSIALLLGWMAGLSAVTVTVYVFAARAGLELKESLSTLSSVVELSLGVFFVGAAVYYWLKRRREGDEPRMPRWLSVVDRLKPVTSLVTGIILGIFNMKNLPLSMMAAVDIAEGDLGAAGSVFAFAVFILVASAGMIIPAAIYLIAGDRAHESLESTKGWLIRYNSTVMMAVFIVLALILTGKSVAALAG